MNLFSTVLTYTAPSANYRGESELNRSVIQKITDGRFDYPIISPEAMRNALREILAGPGYDLPSNRSRLHDEEQLAVKFADYPDPDSYVDDFFFGYLVAVNNADRKKIKKELADKRGKDVAEGFTFKRDSILRMNLARGLEPYRHNAVFTQSPLAAEGSAYRNSTSSALLHRETAVTAFQYPFALNLNDCAAKPEWTRALLKAIGELNDVAGNHARSYFEMAPASIVVRLTNSLVAGYDTYGFRVERNTKDDQQQIHNFPEVIAGIVHDDYPGAEFHFGGKYVKDMPADKQKELTAKCVTLLRDPRKVLEQNA
ncbi:MAG: type I-B CRISPR-associated protein Cas7/Cst2/DevR, partial [Planctomycetota bacterium]